MSDPQVNAFYWEYDLTVARRHPREKQPAAHQREALEQLSKRFAGRARPYDGGILVLPTGGGKTFTAIRFLCTAPLSQGWKVLWLAHTHHLLEQAFTSIASEVGLIAEPKSKLSVRVVSGTPGHNAAHQIAPTDDVVIGTLQTIAGAKKRNLAQLTAWLAAAGERLLVVFDEAHHAPAYSYRTLIKSLRDANPGMYLLGLTATPTYSDERRSGFLNDLFPQRFIYQVATQKLMAQSILAQPVFEDHRTDFTVDFDEREYQKWIGTYRDLPEDLITKLAASKERNAYIAQSYVQNRERYGKTIIFADRWFQCEQICAFLRGPDAHKPIVRAGAIYTHIDADPGTPEARNRHTADENKQVLEAFRRGELDVLINVRMLTEGTDVPDVNTVFLTRQTTSQILLTQMIGRALRGPKFGGTDKAHIVSFIDNWKQLINWAEYQVPDGEARDGAVVAVKRPPLQLISIDLVRHVIEMLGSGEPVELDPFLTMLPIGWYRVEFLAQIAGSDEQANVQQMVMVFDGEHASFERFITALAQEPIEAFEDELITLETQREQLEAWRRTFFADVRERVGEELLISMFHIVRHVASNGAHPDFFPFEERQHHDLDELARDYIAADLGPRKKNDALLVEYQRADRYWSVIYPNYPLFKAQYDACENAILQGARERTIPANLISMPGQVAIREPSDAVKAQVKKRDHYRCQSCGEYRLQLLEIDHVAPFYHGGSNALGNLQTLCHTCNQHKGINEVNFRTNQTPLQTPPPSFPALDLPLADLAGDITAWEQFLRRSINFFYRCAAVESVTITDVAAEPWDIHLWAGNNPGWLEPALPELLQRITQQRFSGGRQGPAGLSVRAPEYVAVAVATTVAVPVVTTEPAPVLPAAPYPTTARASDRQAVTPSAQDDTRLVLITTAGSVSQRHMDTLSPQARGGRGVWIGGDADTSPICVAQIVSPADTLLCFSQYGRAYALPVQAIGDGTHTALRDRIELSDDEEIWAVLPIRRLDTGEVVILATQQGKVKCMSLRAFTNMRASGRSILSRNGNDVPIGVRIATTSDEVVLLSAQGQAIRFPVSNVPVQEHEAGGVAGLRLADGDVLTCLDVIPSAATSADLLVVAKDGYAKRTPLADFSRQHRGGVGVVAMPGRAISMAKVVTEQRDVIFVSWSGMALRTAVGRIAQQGRPAQGVSAMRLADDDGIATALAL
ncbi:MAG: DNA gyrase C-terminal beta-propeller domain-containing protein [Chloroflexales bacterium]